jgi:hypothetical protein
VTRKVAEGPLELVFSPTSPMGYQLISPLVRSGPEATKLWDESIGRPASGRVSSRQQMTVIASSPEPLRVGDPTLDDRTASGSNLAPGDSELHARGSQGLAPATASPRTEPTHATPASSERAKKNAIPVHPFIFKPRHNLFTKGPDSDGFSHILCQIAT